MKFQNIYLRELHSYINSGCDNCIITRKKRKLTLWKGVGLWDTIDINYGEYWDSKLHTTKGSVKQYHFQPRKQPLRLNKLGWRTVYILLPHPNYWKFEPVFVQYGVKNTATFFPWKFMSNSFLLSKIVNRK